MYPLNATPICQQMQTLDITGNVIPKRWYHTIVSVTEANQNFSRVTRITEKAGQAVI